MFQTAAAFRPQIRQASFGGGWVPYRGKVYTDGYFKPGQWFWYAHRLSESCFTPLVRKIMSITQKILPKLPTLIVAGGIFFLSSQSTLPSPRGILGFDKLQHMIAYMVLAGTMVLWFPREQWQSHRLRTLLLAVLVSSVYGISDEVHQYFVPGRDCNVWDWLADLIGSFLGAAAVLSVGRYLFGKGKVEENQPVAP